jgi:hypothetical protein
MASKGISEQRRDFLRHPQGSIFEKGYGSIAKKVMEDKSLSIEAKAIYAYFCSYTGSGDVSFPSVQRICTDLCIGRNRFYQHMTKLVDMGYIKKEQKHDDKGHKTNNEYELVYIPKPKAGV